MILAISLRLDFPSVGRPLALGPKPERQVRLRNFPSRALYANSLNPIFTGSAQASHIDKGEWNAAESHRLGQYIARRAGNFCRYRRFALSQSVEECGLSRIWRTGQGDAISLFQNLRTRCIERCINIALQSSDTSAETLGQFRNIVLIIEIECSFYLRRQSEEALPPALDLSRQRSACHRHCALSLNFGFGGKQIGKTLGFRQINTPIGKGAARELTGLCPAAAFHRRQSRFDRCDDCAPTVAMQFAQILSRDRARPGEKDEQAIIKRIAVRVAKSRTSHRSGFRDCARHRLQCRTRIGAGDTDHTDTGGRSTAR